jgi:hypothetical protein
MISSINAEMLHYEINIATVHIALTKEQKSRYYDASYWSDLTVEGHTKDTEKYI